MVIALFVGGFLALQTAWILVVPPMDGMDEFDHVFRAGAVAHGQWRTNLGQAPDGRGKLVVVDADLPEAARETCESLNYTLPDNCRPVSELDDGRVVIASAAAIYPPTYYALVGWSTHVSDGFSAVYGMRVMTSLLSAACVGLAAWLTLGGRPRTLWPLAGLAAVWTPTAVYSTVIVSANGLEMAMGALIWTALIRIGREIDDAPPATSLVLIVLGAASVFAWVRPFSPIWLGLILVAWLILIGFPRFVRIVRSRPVLVPASMIGILVAASTAVWWVLANPSTDATTQEADASGRAGATASQLILWPLQVISGVPFRNNAAPAVVYAFGIAMLAIFLGAALRRRGRAVPATLFIVVSTLAVAVWYTWTRYPTAGLLWQGRYLWPVALGAVVIAGWALDGMRAGRAERISAAGAAVALTVTHVFALRFVLNYEKEHSVLSGDDAWQTLPTAAVITIGIVGCLVMAIAVSRSAHHESSDAGMVS